MTVTVVFGKTSDAYLHNYASTYSSARTGPADAVTGGNVGYFGQNANGGQYFTAQTFIGFDYAAIPDTERVTAAMIRVKPAVVVTPGITQDMYVQSDSWGPASVDVGDWNTPANLSASARHAEMENINQGLNKFALGGSDELLSAVIPATSVEHVIVSSRQYNGTTPTTDEGFAIHMADASGTADDPALIYTSALRSTLYGVMGAQVQLSDGTWCYLESNGATSPTVTLKHETAAGVTTSIGTLPIGGAATDFFTPTGLQAYALIVDNSDNLYVFGRCAAGENVLGGKAYTKGVGYTWTPVVLKSAAMPAISTAINQCAATYHTSAGGMAHVVIGHVPSPGHPTVVTDTMSAQMSLSHLRTGTGTLLLGSRSVLDKFFPLVARSDYLDTYPNETGSGMDIAAAIGGNPEWGFFYSFQHGQIPGDNSPLASCRYIMNTAATSYTHHTTQPDLGWGRKDANGKVRVVPISSSIACFVSVDADAGYSLTVYVQQHTGTDSGSVTLEGRAIGGEGIASFPDGPALAQSAAWDCIYNSTENKLWIYYVDVADGGRIMRTSFNLTTYQFDQNAIQVYSHASGTVVCQGIRVERNKAVGQTGLVSIAFIDGVTRTLITQTDTFNLAPTAPTLTPEPNFDATTAQTFQWTFNDPNVGDTQSALQLEISRVSDGVVVHDTGKVVSATPSRTVTGGTLTNGVAYQWRVRTYDALDAVSPWSGYGTFSTSAGGTVTITDPAADWPTGVVTDDYQIDWSVVGSVQASYRVWLYRGATLVSDTGWIASTATTHLVTGMLSDQDHRIDVQTRNAALVTTGIGSRYLRPSFSVPETPLISVSPIPESGYVLISVENPAPGEPALGVPEEDFETGVGTFTAPSGGTFVQSADFAHKGGFSGKLTTTGTPTQTYVRSAQATIVTGERYTARMWVYRPVAGNVSASIDWYTAGSVYVSTSVMQVAVAAGVWTLISVTGTCPATATKAAYGPTLPGNPATGTIVYADEVVLTGSSDRPDVTRNEILRRKVGDIGEWEVVGECDPDGTFRDYQAGAGVTYEYIARGQA